MRFLPKTSEIIQGIYHELLEAGFSDESIENLKKAKFDEKDYGAYSEKAVKKLLALMRMGKYWAQDNIDTKTLDRIKKIIVYSKTHSCISFEVRCKNILLRICRIKS